jgi:hypothetical protein
MTPEELKSAREAFAFWYPLSFAVLFGFVYLFLIFSEIKKETRKNFFKFFGTALASPILVPYAMFRDMFVSRKLRKEWELNLPKTFRQHFGFFHFDPQVQKYVDQKMAEVAKQLHKAFSEEEKWARAVKKNDFSSIELATYRGETLEEKGKSIKTGVGIYKNYFNFLKNLALSFNLEVKERYSDYLVGSH